ncbi:WbqC family protein [Magnetospirillum fulvum]|nr:WbqC family protein [Magnetospirillum fulvum]
MSSRHAKSCIVAILQSNYIPWKGYFDIIARSDKFILFDNVQYTKRDWRNRNKIKTANGELWLTIPVEHKGEQRISEVMVANRFWPDKHWTSIERAYGKAAGFNDFAPRLRELYELCRDMDQLSAVNRLFITSICEFLGLNTQLFWSTDLLPVAVMDAADPTDRLVELCVAAGADTYLSGPAARAYLDEERFLSAGIRVEWMDYSGYLCYPQRHGEFTHTVSVLDLLLNVGNNSRRYLKYAGES